MEVQGPRRLQRFVWCAQPEKQVVVHGVARDLQRLMCPLVPSNLLQRHLGWG